MPKKQYTSRIIVIVFLIVCFPNSIIVMMTASIGGNRSIVYFKRDTAPMQIMTESRNMHTMLKRYKPLIST